MSTRRRRLIVLMTLSLALVITAILLNRWDREATPQQRARVLAGQACATMGKVVDAINADAASSRVMNWMDEATAASAEAADLDPRWRSLTSGVEAVHFALKEDDASAARVGISVVEAQCKSAGVSVVD